MPTYARMLPVLTALLLVSVGNTRAGEWPGWRGPSTDMVARDVDALEVADDVALAVSWRVPLGSGYSSVSVAHGLAVTAFSDGVDDVVIAFSATTGDELWRHPIDSTYIGHDGSQTGPISTPYVTEDLVYALGPNGRLVAVETANGDEVWTRDLVTDDGANTPFYGFATSPLVVDDVLLLQIGAGNANVVAGFDRHTGAPRWHAGDGGVQYQSPSLMRLGGETQLVFATNSGVGGIRPSTGEMLWTATHGGDGGDVGSGSTNPLAVDSARLFLTHKGSSSILLDLHAVDGRIAPEKVWESRSIRSSYSVPVYHDGHLYSYSSSILTCVDAATGAPVWKSRRPGPGFPIVVNGNLVIATQKGGLHLARATPAGYEELAALTLSDELIWAPPSFADGSIFVRSLGEIARVEVVAKAAQPEAVATPAVDTGFRRFLREARNADDKAAVVDSFMAARAEFPIIEDDGTVWFVYRGAAEQDVAIVGDFLGNRRAEPMQRLDGTDLYYYAATVEPEGRLNYGFVVDFDTNVLDPLNPRSVPLTMRLYDDRGGESSWFAMPAWRPADHLAEDARGPHGRVETMEIPTSDGGVRTVDVYVPPGHDDSTENYPVAYVHWGDPTRRLGQMTASLDNLTGDTVRPVIVVYVHRKGGGFNELVWGGRPGYIRSVAEEVAPAIEARYRTAAGRDARASIGYGFGGLAALDLAFSYPELFAKVAAQSPMRETVHENDVLSRVTTAAASPFDIWLGWGKYGTRSTLEGWSLVAWNDNLRAFFEERGYAAMGGEVNQGPGWESWRQRNDEVFEALFPMP
jgi:enterochelin esterase-like enzyme/outer membrane protein assembly factor BamB